MSNDEQRDAHGLRTLEGHLEGRQISLRVSNSTPAKTLATAILRYLDEDRQVVLSCIGPFPQAQALKAVGIANGEMAQQGRLLAVVPAFEEKKIHDRDTGREVEMTAMRFIVCRLPVVL